MVLLAVLPGSCQLFLRGFAMPDHHSSPPSILILLLKLLLLLCVLGMLAAGLSPLYQAFMRLTGLGEKVPAPAVVASQPVSLSIDEMAPGQPWQVRPLQGPQQVTPGQFVQLMVEVRNNQPHFAAMQALPVYQPVSAAAYVQKLDCFCFSQQLFSPGQVRRFPVVLVISTQLPAQLRRISVSYQIQDQPA